MKIMPPTLEDVKHSGQEDGLGQPVEPIALGRSSSVGHPASDDVPVSCSYCLNQVKLEESENMIKEEEVEVKIEDDDSCEGSDLNSFEAHQYKNRINGNDQELGRTWRNIDDIVELGLTLRKEVKEEPNDLSGPPLEDEILKEENMLYDKEFDPPVSSYEDANDVKPLINNGPGVSHSLNSFLKTPNSSRTIPIERKRTLKGKLNWLFNFNDKLYHCNQCGYKAKNAQFMEYHRATHTGEKPYECKFCDYKACHPTTLRRHMRRHTGEKPHACKLCDYRAAQPTALVNHMRCVHTGERPFSCDVCPFKAHDQGSLAGHKLSHLLPEEKPYECEICGIRMTRRPHLLRHAMSKHPGQTISLDRRFSATKKHRLFKLNANATRSRSKMQPQLYKRSKTIEEMFGSTSESSSPLSSDDEANSPIIDKRQQFSSDDQEYRPDKCVTPSGASSLSERPRRSIVAPKKLDL